MPPRTASRRAAHELKKHAFIGGGGPKLWRAYSAWLHDLGLDDRIIMHHASAMGMMSAIRSGLGIAVLPCIVADADPDLIQCVPPKDDHGRVMWLVTHERVRHTPRVRIVIDFLYEKIMRAHRDAGGAARRGRGLDRTASPFWHWPLAKRHLDRRSSKQPRGIEDRQGETSCVISSGISVQTRATASQPSSASFSMIRT